ncbi:MAG: hypothetical protein VX613_01665 [Candidatus Thermoplasmatota archaeon]|nr:hypothetical protein [Candidatus Thermoplasmatota archaeon]
MKNNKKIVVKLMLLTLFFTIFSTITTAENSNIVLATKNIDFEKNANLIEWFSPSDCEPCRNFENSNINSEVIWINWFNAQNDKINNLARADTNKRMIQLNESSIPLLVVNGNIVTINENDTVDTWSKQLEQSIKNNNQNDDLINISMNIDLLDSTGDNNVNEIKLYGKITPLQNLHNDTAIHIHIIENFVDSDGSGARSYVSNVLREWVHRMDFSVEKDNSTDWEYSLSETYLESAGINFEKGDSNKYSVIISVHGESLENDTEMRVLMANSAPLPSLNEQGEWKSFPLILLGNIILISGLVFIVIQERIREKGLPLIEGKIIHSNNSEKKINLNIKTGNKKVEIIKVEVSKGWRASRLKKLPVINQQENFDFDFKVINKRNDDSEQLPLQITVKTDVEDLGQWMMDIDMILEKNE